MDITALVMAGGKGSRLGLSEEKPLIKVGGKPMIQRVIEALSRANKVKDIVVTTTRYTPSTATFVRRMSIKVLQTPGEGFCLDMKYAIKSLNLRVALVIGADLPLISSDIIDKIIMHYEQCGKPVLTVMAPAEIYKRLGLSISCVFESNGNKLVPLCINIINGGMIDKERLDEEILIIEDERAIVNVNTLNDLKIAEYIMYKLKCF
jgi:adenosylcobinamide-phosphate guanylyltransferase